MMVDNTQSLFSQIDPVTIPSEAVPLLGKHISTLNDAVEDCMGSFGWNQFFQALLVSLACVFDAQQTFISVFAEAAPAWHCIDDHDQLCNSGTTQCQLSKTAWAWNQPAETCLVSEWNLECASGPLFVSGLPASSFFFGCLMGGIVLATLADSSLGRKNMLVLSCLVMSLAGVLTVFSPNIWVYSALRFVTGLGRATIGTCALVLSTELVGKKWRGQAGILGFFCFTIGFLSLPAMAYLKKDSSWRTLYIWTSIPAVFYSTIVYFMVHESPRWLFVQGRKEEAIKVLRSMSTTSINFNFADDALVMDKETWNVDLYSGLVFLWQKGWAFRRLSSVMIAGFGIGMVYYGVPLGLANLKFNLYLSVTLNALSELPASLLTFFLIGKLNRRSAVLVFTIVSGVCSILCAVVVDEGLQIWLELVSFFSACTAFNVLLIYTLELFPTCIRNSALSMVRQALVLSGVFSPVLVAAGKKDGFWSYGVFGLVIGCCGFIVVCLPETRGGSFCDTIDEQECKDIKASVVTATLVGCDNGV